MQLTSVIGQIHGARIQLHLSLIVVIPFILLAGLVGGYEIQHYAHLTILAFLTFVSLTLHELGHVVVAHHLGLPSVEVTVFPFGAVSRFAREPESHGDDLAISLAGPAVSFLLGGLFLMLGNYTSGGSVVNLTELATANIATQMAWINIAIGALNILPVLPLDGGRIFRSLLSLFVPESKASTFCLQFSIVIATILFLTGFSGQPQLFLVSGIIFFGATRDTWSRSAKSYIKDLRAIDIATGEFKVLASDTEVLPHLDYILNHKQRDFPVTRNGRVVAFLSRKDLKTGLAGGRKNQSVIDLVRPDFPRVQEDAPISEVIATMQREDLKVIPVFSAYQFCGVIFRDVAKEHMLEQEVQNEAIFRSERKLF